MTLGSLQLQPHKLHLQVAGLLALGVFVWLRDLAWIHTASDTITVLAALPILYWLGGPWDKRQPEWNHRERRVIGVSAACFVFGILTNFTVLFAVAWAHAFWAIANAGVHPDPRRRLERLLPLAVLAFPWITLDCHAIGFWFRLTGAQAAEHFLRVNGVAVERLGTVLQVGSIRLDVTNACGGLHSLQTVLIGGFALAYVQLSHSRAFWLSVPIMIVAAWTANTLRILLTAYIAVWSNPQWASGTYHEWQGLGVLLVCFLICAGVFACLRDDGTPIAVTTSGGGTA